MSSRGSKGPGWFYPAGGVRSRLTVATVAAFVGCPASTVSRVLQREAVARERRSASEARLTLILYGPLSSWNGSWCDSVSALLFLRQPCYMKNMSNTVLDRFLRPFTECLTPEVAQRIVNLQLDSQSQVRLDELAAKANEGQLTDNERQEYEEFVEGIDLMGILKARARTVLAQSVS